MSVWSHAALTVKVDREKIKVSIRDWIKELDVENDTKVDIKEWPDKTQLLSASITDSSEVDVFCKKMSAFVNTCRQTYGVLWVECEIEGRL